MASGRADRYGSRMLARYQIVRGKRPTSNPLPKGTRIDVRKHTRHVLSPPGDWVTAYLAAPTDAAWHTFARRYEALLEERYRTDPTAFDALAERARAEDVFIGCNCPTAKNPDVRRCHTVIALGFLSARYPDLEVRIP